MLKQIKNFALIGGIGFITDGGILTLLNQQFEQNVYASRLVSFTCATLVTWALNRTFTFKDSTHKSKKKEYSGYVLIQVIGSSINLSIFSLLLLLFPILAPYPIIPLAVGAGIAMVFNFTSTKFILYR